MMRDLHPDRESAGYVVAWFGASWRLCDFTPPLTGLPDYAWMNPPDTGPRSTAPSVRRPVTRPMATIAAALTTTPQTIADLSAGTGISYCKVRQWLAVLVKSGRALPVTDTVTVKLYRRFRSRPIVRYRRAA